MKDSRLHIAILTILGSLMLVATGSCIKNDIPYPTIQANITYISAVGQERNAQIDSANRVATLYFAEDANIYYVKIDSLALSPNTIVADSTLAAGCVLDLSSPVRVVLSMYQDYVWKIEASQDIVREFVLEGQIGTSTIDVPGHRVIATVSDAVSLESIYVEQCKLGPSTATAVPNITGKHVDFTNPVVITLENYGHLEQWTIYVEQTEATVQTVSVDGWTRVGWVYCQAQAGKANTVEYRIKGDTEWLRVPDSWLTSDGGSYYARLTGLQPMTTYEARAVSDDEYGMALEFTTGMEAQMPNSSFEDWWLDGKVWCPWAEGGERYWDTGNKGAATLGQSNSVPTDDTVTGTGQCAKLETKFIGIGMLGKLGAGNIFVGEYLRTEGTNGVLSMGRPFTERPTKLVGYCKYETAPISSVTTGFEDWKGRPDTCSIWIALMDSAQPLEIRTNPNNRQLFDPNSPDVIAYGYFQSGESIPAYAPFEVELKYKATNRVPRYILCAASASKYGDFFTGGNGAVLYVDEFELKYDY